MGPVPVHWPSSSSLNIRPVTEQYRTYTVYKAPPPQVRYYRQKSVELSSRDKFFQDFMMLLSAYFLYPIQDELSDMTEVICPSVLCENHIFFRSLNKPLVSLSLSFHKSFFGASQQTVTILLRLHNYIR